METIPSGADSHDWGPDGPVKGAVLYDAEWDRSGVYLDTAANGRLWLRPVGGGREWPADPARTYPVAMADEVRGRAADAGPTDGGYPERMFGPEPLPYHGCGECAELDARRDRLRVVGDLSGVTDCNVLIRRHPHEVR